MPLTINTNSAAAKANMHLERNNDMLRKSLNRLSSGSRIVQPVDDAGGLAVSVNRVPSPDFRDKKCSKCRIISKCRMA